MNNEDDQLLKEYRPLALAAGIGSMLGSGCIVGLSATIPVWQKGLGMSVGEVGIISGALTFAIAFGSLFAGQISKKVGLFRTFNWVNLFYGLGAILCIMAHNFLWLLLGVVIMGFSSGLDLPISLTVVSCDSPNEFISAKLVSSTQVFWQIGVFISYICSFLLSGTSGLLGARIVFLILLIFSVIALIWRLTSKKFQLFHKKGIEKQMKIDKQNNQEKKYSITAFLFKNKTNANIYLKSFMSILIFYVCWNLLANTWGQFQTYALTNAGASQTQATGLGIVLNVISLITTMIFASVSGGKYRNKAFFVGAFVQFTAMIGMSIFGGSVGFAALAFTIALYNFGNPLAGEAIYKVWTQESFPTNYRASIQGFINGFSRLCCGLFALITPFLVSPNRIQSSMILFSGIVVIATLAGINMMNLQKKSR